MGVTGGLLNIMDAPTGAAVMLSDYTIQERRVFLTIHSLHTVNVCAPLMQEFLGPVAICEGLIPVARVARHPRTRHSPEKQPGRRFTFLIEQCCGTNQEIETVAFKCAELRLLAKLTCYTANK